MDWVSTYLLLSSYRPYWLHLKKSHPVSRTRLEALHSGGLSPDLEECQVVDLSIMKREEDQEHCPVELHEGPIEVPITASQWQHSLFYLKSTTQWCVAWILQNQTSSWVATRVWHDLVWYQRPQLGKGEPGLYTHHHQDHTEHLSAVSVENPTWPIHITQTEKFERDPPHWVIQWADHRLLSPVFYHLRRGGKQADSSTDHQNPEMPS